MGSSKILAVTLLVVSLPAFGHGFGQNSGRNTRDQSQDQRQDQRQEQRQDPGQDRGQDRGNDRSGRSPSNFKGGLRDGGHGGQYYDPRHERDGYNDRFRQDNGYDQQQQGGIGPGKGALIGGAGGAVLGAIFGGGLKGTIIGGAAGAGIGAVVGEANQNNRQRNDDRRR
jgi:hypothetical protein